MAELYWLKRPFAHRGLHDAARGIVENSASAVRAAMGKGFGVELDLRCASDHMPVVFHDATLDRLTAETGPVAKRSAGSLASISLRNSNDRILTLPGLLEIVDGRVPLLLEVKSTWNREGKFEANIADMLAAYKGPVAVMSFDPHALEAFRKVAENLPRGLVAERFDKRDEWTSLNGNERFAMRHLLSAAIARPHFIAYDIRVLPALAPLVARNVFGLPLLTWTVRNEEERARALRYADAMIFEGIQP